MARLLFPQLKNFYPVNTESKKFSKRPKKNTRQSDQYEVVIIDNDHNSYEEVMSVCMATLGCNFTSAYTIAWTVDNEGSCSALVADLEEAKDAARYIGSIGIEVKIIKVSVQ